MSRLLKTLPIALLLSLTLACEEEGISEIYPDLLVCADENAAPTTCNQAIDLGEVFTTVESEFTIYAKNGGRAPLALRDVRVSVEHASVDPTNAPINIGESEPLTLSVTPTELGEQSFDLTFESDDPDSPELVIPVRLEGTPAPAPEIELCSASDGREDCDADLLVDLGVVRRTQQESRLIVVKNVGTAPLTIESVDVTTASSLPGELVVTTSTRPGTLEPGADAPVIVRYEPKDGALDEMTIAFTSDAQNAEVATVTVRATSDDNAPPVASAVELDSSSTVVEVKAGETLFVDGAGSSDPEGDPLSYAWTLVKPAQSQSALSDPTAGRASFVPDIAGVYRAELVVTDSLGHVSDPASVEITALPAAALRVRLSWDAGGDVDVHLVRAGDALFSADACYFDNPRPDWGVTGEPVDDPELIGDAEAAPAVENLVLREPAAGTYEVWAQVFDDGGVESNVRAEVTLFDASFPAFDGTETLPATCDAWHVGDVTFPGGMFVASTDAVSSICP